MAQFQFVMRSGPNPGRAYPVEGPELIIGRDTANQVAINDAEISRKHAKLTLHGNAYVLEDLGSTNGTFVNGQRLSGTKVLNPGDSVSFGENIVLLFEASYDPNATAISTPKGSRTEASAPKPSAPAYSGQVPAGPPSGGEAKPKAKKKFPLWLIILVLVLGVVCACVVFFVVIDQFRLWCQVVPFLVPLLGGTC